jgi:hypothetical protein
MEYWIYNKAIENGCITQQEINNYSFNNEIIGLKIKTF